jgi:hypothetical protein
MTTTMRGIKVPRRAKGASSESGGADLPRWAFVALSVVLPLGLLALHRTLGHQGDLRFFFDWYCAVTASPAFYRDGPGVNYPILGVLVLAAPARLVEALGATIDFERYRDVVKLTLAAAEVLLVLVAARLGRALGLRRPRLAAVGLWLLPSTWAMGAWFGQIDVVGTLLLLLAAWAAAEHAQAAARGDGVVGLGWLGLALVALDGAVLTKQLTLFSVPAVALMLVPGLVLAWRRGRRPWIELALVVLSPALLFAADPFLELPAGYRSHLWFVLAGGGSAHGDVLVATGANLWSLFYEPNTSSRTTLLGGAPVRAWALALYVGAWLICLACAAVEARRLARAPGELAARLRALATHCVVLAGVSNLAMVVLLPGVHERYLVHGAPFLALGLARWAGEGGRTRKALCIAAWAISAWAGLFALASIHWGAFDAWPQRALREGEPLAVLQGALLLALLVAWVARARVEGSDPPT